MTSRHRRLSSSLAPIPRVEGLSTPRSHTRLPLTALLLSSLICSCQGPGEDGRTEERESLDIRQQNLSVSPTITSSNGLSLCDYASGPSASPINTVLTAAGSFASGTSFEWQLEGFRYVVGREQTLRISNASPGTYRVRWVSPFTGFTSPYSPPLKITTRVCGKGTAAADHMVDKNPPFGPKRFTCNPKLLPYEQLRRLTRSQYVNTVTDLFNFALKATPAEARAALNEVSFAGIRDDVRTSNPRTDPRGGYRRLDQAVGDGQVTGFYAVAEAAGKALTKDSRLATLAGSCATDLDTSNDAKCVADFVAEFGSRALRRPLVDSEIAFYKGFYAASTTATKMDPAGFADIISALLQAPQFLYMFEYGMPVQPDTFLITLTDFELAARLSYHFWQSMPDETLWQLALAGKLADAAVYKAEVARLFRDSRTHATIKEFYYDYLQIADFMKSPMNRMNEVRAFKDFAGPNLPSPYLASDMADEVESMFWSLTSRGRTYADLMTSTENFTQSRDLNAIYGNLQTADAAPYPAALPGRRGFLTRGRFVASGSTATRPVMKGLFIRRSVLCDKINPPPLAAQAIEQEPSPNETSRQVTTRVTRCGEGCHKYINELGFATETFDGLGRSRTHEKLYSPEGNHIASAPIDASFTPRLDGTDETKANGPTDLSDRLLASGKGQACLARNYFRFTFGRWENVDADGCMLETVRTALEGTGTLEDMLKAIALAPEFKQRSIASAQ